MPFFTVSTPDGRTFRKRLPDSGLRIGRASGNDLVLADEAVSRREHARVERRADGDYVAHIRGKNGTFVNDARIAAPTRLRTGDSVRVGNSTLVYNEFPASSVELSRRSWPGSDATIVMSAEQVRTSISGELDTLPGRQSSSLLEMILEADRELVAHKPLDEMYESVMKIAQRIAPFERGLIMILRDGRLTPQWLRLPPDESEGRISVCHAIADRVVEKKESILSADALADDRLRGAESVVSAQIRSVICVPLLRDGEVIGLLYVDSRRRPGLFTEETLIALSHLAHVAASKIETKRLFDRAVEAGVVLEELRKAANIQAHLLPSAAPRIDGYLLHGESTPCHAVGGDYFDYIELPGNRIGLALGDVAGKGLSAALLMCSLQSSLRALAELDLPVAETFARLNELLCRRLPSNRFITQFYGLLNRDEHTLDFVNAGQCRPYLIRRDGRAEPLEVSGMPLGIMEDADYSGGRILLEPGDLVFCYSDGVIEARNKANEQFGEQGLLSVVLGSRGDSPESLIERINGELDRHVVDVHREDDVTMLALKREG